MINQTFYVNALWSVENRRHGAKLLQNYVKQASISARQLVQLEKLVLLMRKRCSVCQEANCSHAQYYFAVFGFMGIAISKIVALTLLIIFMRNSQRCLPTDQCLCV